MKYEKYIVSVSYSVVLFKSGISLFLNNGVTQWQDLRGIYLWIIGTLRFFFKISFSKISRSHSQGIHQYLSQPNACKRWFSFEILTVVGSRSFLCKVTQCNTNFRFHQLRRALTNINELRCTAQLVETRLNKAHKKYALGFKLIFSIHVSYYASLLEQNTAGETRLHI